ncbi:hypothetical protein DXT96_06115 [Agrobacterium sp. ICMP 6402]|nr:hypothetical protein [Agrobacterium sp. ICMP 6402]
MAAKANGMSASAKGPIQTIDSPGGSMRSSIEIFNIRTRQMRVVWQTPELFEAPNWSPDGKYPALWSSCHKIQLRADAISRGCLGSVAYGGNRRRIESEVGRNRRQDGRAAAQDRCPRSSEIRIRDGDQGL